MGSNYVVVTAISSCAGERFSPSLGFGTGPEYGNSFWNKKPSFGLVPTTSTLLPAVYVKLPELEVRTVTRSRLPTLPGLLGDESKSNKERKKAGSSTALSPWAGSTNFISTVYSRLTCTGSSTKMPSLLLSHPARHVSLP